MRYEDARLMVASGDLIALKDRHGVVNKAISLITRSPYTHTSVAVWVEGRLLVAETQSSGSCLRPLSDYRNTSFDVLACPVPPKQAVLALWDLLGDKIAYDFADLFRITANRLLGIPLPPVENGRLICSALSAAIYLRAGWQPEGLPSIPAPDDLVRAVGGPLLSVSR